MAERRLPLDGETNFREWMRKVKEGEIPRPPASALIGFQPTEIRDDGTVVFEMDTDARHGNPMGTLHGGILCDIGDAAMGCAVGVGLEDGESFTTLELKINFLKPIWEAHLVATARIVKKTRTICLVECDIVDEKDSLVARLSSTCMILRGQAAKGR